MAGSRSAKKWRWDEGKRAPAKLAAALGATIERLRSRKGKFEARDIVRAARPKSSPIHALFEWNNARAGERWRENQARDYVRHLVVVFDHDGEEATMPVAVSFGSGTGYVSTESAMSSTALRALLLKQALAEAESWRDRYRHLVELAEVFAAIDRARIGGRGMEGKVRAAR